MLPYDDPRLFLNPEFRFAVINASNDTNSKEFFLFRLLKDSGFSVIPIHPEEKKIQDVFSFPSISSARPFPDVVVLSSPIPPEKGLELLREMRDVGLFRLWAEPGTFSEEMRKFAAENRISVLEAFPLADELFRLPGKLPKRT